MLPHKARADIAPHFCIRAVRSYKCVARLGQTTQSQPTLNTPLSFDTRDVLMERVPAWRPASTDISRPLKTLAIRKEVSIWKLYRLDMSPLLKLWDQDWKLNNKLKSRSVYWQYSNTFKYGQIYVLCLGNYIKWTYGWDGWPRLGFGFVTWFHSDGNTYLNKEER